MLFNYCILFKNISKVLQRVIIKIYLLEIFVQIRTMLFCALCAAARIALFSLRTFIPKGPAFILINW